VQAERLADLHGVDLPESAQPGAFLQTLWSALPGDQLVGLAAQTCYQKEGIWRMTQTSSWRWLDQIRSESADCAGLLPWARQQNMRSYPLAGAGSVYYNGASRKVSVLNRYAARGGHDDLLLVSAFWADLDVAKRSYDLERGLDLLLSMPLAPTAVVFSGGGLQPVHVLSEPWPVINREAALEYREYSLALYRATFERAGLALDKSVNEAAREMRLPGFINRKPERGGAMARLVYFNPDARYTVAQIKQYAPLPEHHAGERIRLFAPLQIVPNESGTYQVGQEFIHYLVERDGSPPERHPTLLRLAMQAARAGMPDDMFLERVRPIARQWFGSEPHRADDELTRMVRWAYTRVAEDPERTITGTWLIQLTPDGFARAALEAQEALRDRTMLADAPSPHDGESAAPSLPEVRAAQLKHIREYVEAKTPKGLGTYMLVRTPPGAGKTHAAIQVAYEYALRRSAVGSDRPRRGKVAILTQFTIQETAWRQWLQDFGIADTSRAMYIVARNNDQNSAGYCAMQTIADAVAAKGHNAVQMVCKRCPLQPQCEESWYLHQFKRAQKKDIVIARHQHGVIDLLVGYRRLIIFDESPLDVVAGMLQLAVKDLTFAPPVALADQYPELVALLSQLLEALRRIIAANTPVNGYATQEHVRLGGRWLFDRLDMELGGDVLSRLAALDAKPVQRAGQPGFFRLTLEDVAALPYNYLYDLWDIVRYEYETHYLADHKRWNSRLIPYGQTLRIYPMRAFQFEQNTKVVVTDATGQPELYNKAFGDTRTGKAREGYIYESRLQPHARITQWTNSGNSRRTFFYQKKKASQSQLAALEITDIEGNQHALEDLSPDGAALARAKQQIKHLAERHDRSLLVVTYMAIYNDLKKWAVKTSVINPDYIQYYGNLRGRNDFKHLEACLLIGEPRIPPMETFVAAQIWHWDDALPIEFDLDTSSLKTEPYPGYVGPDGKARAYGYPGYRDERLNRMYVWNIQAEMRQCYERIRANAPEILKSTGALQPKFVYIAAQMPCSDHVDEVLHWSQWDTDQAGRAWYEAQIAAGKKGTIQARYIEAVLPQETNYQRAQESYLRVKAALEAEGRLEPDPMLEKSAIQKAIDWLTEPAHPERLNLSVRAAHKAFSQISIGTFTRAFQIIRGGDS
jgi:hypothetical protein